MAWSDMETKQKSMLIATIAIFGVIGYMVYKLFFADSSPMPEPVAAKVQAQPTASVNSNSASSELAVTDNTNAAAPNAVNVATPASTAPQVVELPKRELTPEELALLEERRQVQQQYLQLVNQYQLMEMQNKVATSQAALIKTQLETGKSEQQAAKLGITLPGQESTDNNADKSMRGVSLVYVGQKNGAWSAVLNLSGQYITVKLGSRLPDNSLVSQITDNSIVLYKDGERRELAVPMVVDQPSDEDSDSGDVTASSDDTSSDNTTKSDNTATENNQ